jgi:NDP-sugar pyrophosphorylase family protein
MGTGGALRHALPLLDSDPVLALNGDSFVDLNPAAFLSWYCEHGRPAAALALTFVADAGRYGRVELGPDERIGAFEEKSGGGRPGWINAGIYLLRRALLAGIPAQGSRSLEREVLPQKLADGVFGYCCRGRFIDIGTPQSYRRAGEFFDPPDTGKGGHHK